MVFALLILILRQIFIAEQDWRENTAKAVDESLENFIQKLETTVQTGDINILLRKDDWIIERDRLIENIIAGREISDDRIIRATSSFHPIENIKEDYFDQLAKVALEEDRGIKYNLLIQSGPAEKLVDEMKNRIAALNKNSDDHGWYFGNQFQARKYPFRSNIDVLIYGDYLFVNIKVGDGEAPTRRYIMIKNRKISSIFTEWFDCLYRGNDVEKFELEELKLYGYMYDDYSS
ncbi:MAG: hypothetical protein ACR2RE_31110 [Geminicoccaceae bacterium]